MTLADLAPCIDWDRYHRINGRALEGLTRSGSLSALGTAHAEMFRHIYGIPYDAPPRTRTAAKAAADKAYGQARQAERNAAYWANPTRCECGCGKFTGPGHYNQPPKRFLRGHNASERKRVTA